MTIKVHIQIIDVILLFTRYRRIEDKFENITFFCLFIYLRNVFQYRTESDDKINHKQWNGIVIEMIR